MKTNKHGTNAKFKFNLFSEEKMRELGFTDLAKDRWYYCKNLCDDISFNITIPKDGSEAWIDVLVESFCQPYDYQSFLERNPEHKFAYKIKKLVEEQMMIFVENGIIENYTKGDYI